MSTHYRTNEQILADAKVYCASRNSLFKKNGISVYLYQELLFSKYDVETKRVLLDIYKEKVKLKMYVDNFGWNIGMYAIYYDKMEIFKDLLRELPFIMLQTTTEQFEKFPEGSSMLDVASQMGNINGVFALLKAGIGFDIVKFPIDFQFLNDCQITKEYVELYRLLLDLLVIGDIMKQPSYNRLAPFPALIKAIEAKDKSDKVHKNSTNDESKALKSKIADLSLKARRCDSLMGKTSFDQLSKIFNLSLADYQLLKYNSFNAQHKEFIFFELDFAEGKLMNRFVNVPLIGINGVHYESVQIFELHLRGQNPYLHVLRPDCTIAKFHPATIRLNNKSAHQKQTEPIPNSEFVSIAPQGNTATVPRDSIASKPPGLHASQSDASK